MWNPKVKTKTRKQIGDGGGVSFFTDVYLDGLERGNIYHTERKESNKRYMATISHKPFKGKYFAKLSTAISYIVREEKRYVPIEKAFENMWGNIQIKMIKKEDLRKLRIKLIPIF